MDHPEHTFSSITKKLANQSDISDGKMMSSPGLMYKDKVFAFYHKEAMGFRPGPNFDPQKMGVLNAKPLSPFKTKPPLNSWLMVEKHEAELWEPLTEMALEFTKTLK